MQKLDNQGTGTKQVWGELGWEFSDDLLRALDAVWERHTTDKRLTNENDVELLSKELWQLICKDQETHGQCNPLQIMNDKTQMTNDQADHWEMDGPKCSDGIGRIHSPSTKNKLKTEACVKNHPREVADYHDFEEELSDEEQRGTSETNINEDNGLIKLTRLSI